jgi:hypothetical protein
MKQFRATVRASGVLAITVVYTENTTFAINILQAQVWCRPCDQYSC